MVLHKLGWQPVSPFVWRMRNWHVFVLANGGTVKNSVPDPRGNQATFVEGMRRMVCAQGFWLQPLRRLVRGKGGQEWTRLEGGRSPLQVSGCSSALTERAMWTASCARRAGLLWWCPSLTADREEHNGTELVCEARGATFDDPDHPFWNIRLFGQAALPTLEAVGPRLRAWLEGTQPPFLPEHLFAARNAGGGHRRREQDGEWRNARYESSKLVCGTLPGHPEHSPQRVVGGVRGLVSGASAIQDQHRPP